MPTEHADWIGFCVRWVLATTFGYALGIPGGVAGMLGVVGAVGQEAARLAATEGSAFGLLLGFFAIAGILFGVTF